MAYQVNVDSLNRLIDTYKDDAEMTGIILDALESFEEYHQAIYSLELQRRLYAHGAIDADTYREKVSAMDQVRSFRHNTVLSNIRLLNRLADQEHIPPFYDGTVSEDHPYRTEVADAVLSFVRGVIADRVTGGR